MKPEVSSGKWKVEPERSGARDGESEQSGDRQSQPEQSEKEEVEPERSGARQSQPEQSPKEEDVELSEDEKLLLNLLKANSPTDLNALKEQTGLSNKKWDKAIKGLTQNRLARVEKTEGGLLVSMV